uniref:Uncharacterized protein n=1 Tax=Amphimedon queenslandica TaxID=400682 RepID=A0A1X7TKX5_AMPQE
MVNFFYLHVHVYVTEKEIIAYDPQVLK